MYTRRRVDRAIVRARVLPGALTETCSSAPEWPYLGAVHRVKAVGPEPGSCPRAVLGICDPRTPYGSTRARPAEPVWSLRPASSGAWASAGVRAVCSSYTYRPPRSSEATAAIRQHAIAKSNAMSKPCWNDGEISDGRNVCPVRVAAWPGGSLATTGPSSCCIGL